MHYCTVWALSPQANWVAAGQLHFGQAGCTFRYLQSWLQSTWAYSLDPVHLPLAPAIYYPAEPTQVLPLFADLLPQGWVAKLGNPLSETPPQTLYTQFKYRPDSLNSIRLSPADTPLTELPIPSWNDLEPYCQRARQQPRGELPLARYLEFMAGGCWRGERPKLTFQGFNKLWLAKWQTADEDINWPQIEYACQELLAQAGLNVPARHLIPSAAAGWIYLIERFDCAAHQPLYFVSADVLLAQSKSTELDIDARRDPGSYIALARCLRRYSSDAKADLHELFRRLIANIVLNNTQDQLYKFGLVYHLHTRKWRLAPCFGVRPALNQNRYHSLGLGTQGRLRSLANALSLAAEFTLTSAQANKLIADLREQLTSWRDVFEHCGVNNQDRHRLGLVIQTEGV